MQELPVWLRTLGMSALVGWVGDRERDLVIERSPPL